LNKKITLLICTILVVAFVFGACAKTDGLTVPEQHDNADVPALASPGPLPNNDASIVVMEVGGNKVYKDEFDFAYSSICSQYGVAEDDPSLMGLLQDATLDQMLSQQVIRVKLEELGYMDLSPEDAAAVATQAQAELDYTTAYSLPEITADLGEDYTDEELAAATIAFEDDLLAEYGLTRETFMDFFIETKALDNAKAELLKDLVPIEESVITQYNNAVETDKATIGDDLTVYEAYINQNGMSHYIPQGIRFVRHILIRLDDEATNEIATLRQNGDNEAADAALIKALEAIQEETDAILTLLKSGDITFTEGIETYNEDPGMASNPDGYEIYEGNNIYVESFSQGAMSLTTIGDFTDLVASDYGYHIIEYTSDKPSGAIPLEDVYDQIYNALLTNLQDSGWAAQIAQWKEEVPYTIYKDVL